MVSTSRLIRAAPVTHVPLRRGIHVDAGVWGGQYAEGRQRLRALAVAGAAAGPPVLSHVTAAAAGWNLPLYRVSDEAVHVIDSDEHPAKTRGDVVRHAIVLPRDDIVEMNGLLFTSMERTVYDVIRMRPLENALACYDAALRSVAWNDDTRTLDAAAAAAFKAEIDGRIRANTGARGIRQARPVSELADGRAQLPGESVSRLRMWQLSLPMPDLQVAVRTDDGGVYLDFAWPDLYLFGECDGAVKLLDPRYTRGRTPAAVLADAARRQRLIEAATGWTCIRWDADAYRSVDSFDAMLRGNGKKLLSAPRRGM